MAKEDVRNELIESGLKLFSRSGYAATGVKDVVDETRVPKGSFYYYFDSKEAYAEEVVRKYSSKNAEARQRLLTDKSLPPLARLRNYFERGIKVNSGRNYSGGCLLGNLTQEVSDHSELVRTDLSNALGNWQRDIEAVLVEAAVSGELPAYLDPKATAAYILNAWQGSILRMKAEKSARPLEMFVEMTFDHLLK
jgi:TetR/AcrR family transcriptional regulator, transcriptional repressor for nem operon